MLHGITRQFDVARRTAEKMDTWNTDLVKFARSNAFYRKNKEEEEDREYSEAFSRS